MAKRMKYKLPAFPSNIKKTFKALCLPLATQEITKAQQELEDYIVLLENKVREGANVDLNLAHKLAKASRHLLNNYSSFSEDKQALAIGAVRYFVTNEDPLSDASFATGLDDDAAVMNYVLQQIGIEDFFIEDKG